MVHQYPLATVGALIISSSGRILLVKTHKWNHLYTVPGGKIELGETCELALIREVKEETGLDVENVRFILMQESIFSPEFWKKGHFVMHDYLADLAINSGEGDVVLNDEAEEFLWVNPKEAKNLPLTFETKVLLDGYLATLSV